MTRKGPREVPAGVWKWAGDWSLGRWEGWPPSPARGAPAPSTPGRTLRAGVPTPAGRPGVPDFHGQAAFCCSAGELAGKLLDDPVGQRIRHREDVAYTASNARVSASQFFVNRATTSSVVVDRCVFIICTRVARGQLGFALLRKSAMASPLRCHFASACCCDALSPALANLMMSTAIEMCSLSSAVSVSPAALP